jgi:hypothetical protein
MNTSTAQRSPCICNQLAFSLHCELIGKGVRLKYVFTPSLPLLTLDSVVDLHCAAGALHSQSMNTSTAQRLPCICNQLAFSLHCELIGKGVRLKYVFTPSLPLLTLDSVVDLHCAVVALRSQSMNTSTAQQLPCICNQLTFSPRSWRTAPKTQKFFYFVLDSNKVKNVYMLCASLHLH